MAAEEIALHSPSNPLFHNDSKLGFRCNPSQHHQTHLHTHHHITHTTINNPNNNNGKTTRELTGFIEYQNRHYQPQTTTDFRICETSPSDRRGFRDWNFRNGRESSSPTDDGSDSDDDDDDDDGDMDDVDGIHGNGGSVKNAHKANITGEENGSIKQVMKEGTCMLSESDMNDVRSSRIGNHQQGELCQYKNANANAITVFDPNGDLYYAQLFKAEGSGAGCKDTLADTGCGFSGRKDTVSSGGSGESLRAILSDPFTGALMDDAMILPCGHSFGTGGMQYVMRMKACYTCSHPVSENSAAPNLALRSAIHAFLREEELQTNRASKRRNRLYQDGSNYGDLPSMDQTRGRGVQFPFRVSEHVIIKGNKRTPPRFVGREAVVTTQCLNGWCVVKTLDNAESVKLQYRSLAKIQHFQHSNSAAAKISTPNWL